MPRWLHRFEIKPGAWVFVPDDASRAVGDELRKILASRWSAPIYYAHFQPGGHVKAIKRHTSDTLFLKADIKDFFGQISRNRVTRILKEFMPYREARDFATESVVANPTDRTKTILPFGFVQSPIIASICLSTSALGALLDRINGTPGMTVTVYMDDIIVSTSLGPEIANSAFEDIQAAARRSRFPLNPNKLVAPCPSVTVFNIELSYGKVRLTEDRLTEFAHRVITAESGHVVEGIYGYTKTVSPSQEAALRHSINQPTE